jgi:GNAT superfamily N-acetyltransferase
MNNLCIELARQEDLEEILVLQKLCYRKEALRYNDFTIPPLTQTADEIRAEFPGTIFLKAILNKIIIGSIKAKIEHNTAHIGRLMVHPTYQHQGIGRFLIQTIEKVIKEHAPVQRLELFTGELSSDNIHLYESEGYRIYKKEPYDGTKNIVYMEKYF